MAWHPRALPPDNEICWNCGEPAYGSELRLTKEWVRAWCRPCLVDQNQMPLDEALETLEWDLRGLLAELTAA